jgi:hypothetical protein
MLQYGWGREVEELLRRCETVRNEPQASLIYQADEKNALALSQGISCLVQ